MSDANYFKFKRYSFSSESKKHLVRFVDASRKFPSNSYNKNWEILLPKNEDLLNELTVENDVVIDLTTQDSFSKTTQFDKPEKLNTSLIRDAVDSLRDCIAFEERLDEIFDDISDYKDEDVAEVFKGLFESLDSEMICAFGKSLVNLSCRRKLDFLRFYLRFLLIPKLLMDSDIQLITVFKTYLNSFLIITSEEFSMKINDKTIECPKYILNILSNLSVDNKKEFLHYFFATNPMLSKQHFPIIDILIYQDLQVETLRDIMRRLVTVSSTYGDDKTFGKMLMNLIKNSRRSIIHFKDELKIIIATHQSIWKSKLEKEISDCSSENTLMLSQSLRY